MKAAVIRDTAEGRLHIVDRPRPEPAFGEVLVRVGAASLNYRDLLTLQGGYGAQQKHNDLIPVSDGAGEIVAVGPGANRYRPGQRVIACFFPEWIGGEPSADTFSVSLGGSVDGMLAEYRSVSEQAVVATPDHLTDCEAATLATAGLTAWNAIIAEGRAKPGDVVVVQGTGGVSLFALQIAKLAGAEVIVTSSSDEKLSRALELGADHGLNYRTTPEWGREVRRITKGRGADHIVEVGGAETVYQSLRAIRVGGLITMIGVLSGAHAKLALPYVVTNHVRLQGVTVGSREQLEALVRAVTVHGLRPPVDRVFTLDAFDAAAEYLKSGQHFGKICIVIQEDLQAGALGPLIDAHGLPLV